MARPRAELKRGGSDRHESNDEVRCRTRWRGFAIDLVQREALATRMKKHCGSSKRRPALLWMELSPKERCEGLKPREPNWKSLRFNAAPSLAVRTAAAFR